MDSEQTQAVLALLTGYVSHELKLWLESQKGLDAFGVPCDDPQWGLETFDIRSERGPRGSNETAPVPSPVKPFQAKQEPSVQVPSFRERENLPGGACFSSFMSLRQSHQSEGPKTLEEREAQISVSRARAQSCTRCPLGVQRRGVLWGTGPADASIMFIAAGGNPAELDQGRMMPGADGELLERIIAAMSKLTPEASIERIYMTNVIKCSHNPGKQRETSASRCLGWLREEVRAVCPKVIVVWGAFAYHAMVGGRDPISVVRGTVFQFEGVPAIVTHHPHEVSTNVKLKGFIWKDVQQAVELLKQRV